MAKALVSPVGKTLKYLQEVVKESKLISWPSFNQVTFQFLLVVSISALLTCLLYAIDLGLLTSINKLKEVAVR
jgi:preprotein translocase SecE subunit